MEALVDFKVSFTMKRDSKPLKKGKGKAKVNSKRADIGNTPRKSARPVDKDLICYICKVCIA